MPDRLSREPDSDVPPAEQPVGASEFVLDNPVLHSLAGTHRLLAVSSGRVAGYPVDVSPFMAIPVDATAEDWAQLSKLAGDDLITLIDAPTPPLGWVMHRELTVVQMTGMAASGTANDHGFTIVPLDDRDAPEMLELAQRTNPGPFAERTNRLGSFFGVRADGALIAMAGERLRPPGWTEISAVCTDERYRGLGLARALMERVIDGIRTRGDQPFLHVAATNTGAIRLYEHMGFQPRRTSRVTVIAPEA
ncbi:GNAT family N-acetyltransferase [Kribbella sp. NPDC049584]|uniref:GNAT family N-acetyltransferase n=1 Tax=Kribbella sp. NPDC049584 TaxID=3154833 RepID=UPI003419720F